MDGQRRFGGLERLFGLAGAKQIRDAHIAVVGVGGVGSWAAEALARSGVGQLTLIDMDHVSESNINRQIHATELTLGQSKVAAMRDRIAQINPACQVVCVDAFVEQGNWPGLLPHAVSALVDACDDMKAKTLMAAWAIQSKTMFIAVGAAGGKRLAHRVDVDDLSKVTHDPLLAQLRNRLRRDHGAPKEGKKMGITCVFSAESVSGPDATCDLDGDGTLNCSGYGSLVSVTATFGQVAAGWVMDQISTVSDKKS
jgi:tRNA threonylcarbamoyladenosine dehydratase